MRDDEYRKLRRALEEQRDADLELIRAGYRAKLYALDMLSERALPVAPETQPAAETQKPAPETQSPAATEPVTQQTILVYGVQEEIEKILPRLPDVFDKLDIVRALGWEPHRATMHRALDTLQSEKKIAVQTRSRGRHRARYRKVDSSPQDE
jgi:hypothetical protein